MSRVVIKGPTLEKSIENIMTDIRDQLRSRTYRASNELRNSALIVLRGQRSGRRYKVPGRKKYYTASAPGEPPAVRTGTFRGSWQPDPRYSDAFGVYWARIKSDVPYADWLEDGTPGGQMAPRPHHDRIKEHAEQKVFRIYNEPYFNE